MTREELLGHGFKEMDAKIGRLYLNGPFFCRFVDGDKVDYRATDNDMISLGTVGTMDEIMELEKQWYMRKREKAKAQVQLYDMIIEGYEKKLNDH